MSTTQKSRRVKGSKPPAGGEYIQCEKCGTWFTPIFKKQTTCWECRKKARYEECQSHKQKVVVI